MTQRTIPIGLLLTLTLQTNHQLEPWRETHLNSYTQVLKIPKNTKNPKKTRQDQIETLYILSLPSSCNPIVFTKSNNGVNQLVQHRKKETMHFSNQPINSIWLVSIFIFSSLTLFCKSTFSDMDLIFISLASKSASIHATWLCQWFSKVGVCVCECVS